MKVILISTLALCVLGFSKATGVNEQAGRTVPVLSKIEDGAIGATGAISALSIGWMLVRWITKRKEIHIKGPSLDIGDANAEEAKTDWSSCPQCPTLKNDIESTKKDVAAIHRETHRTAGQVEMIAAHLLPNYTPPKLDDPNLETQHGTY